MISEFEAAADRVNDFLSNEAPPEDHLMLSAISQLAGLCRFSPSAKVLAFNLIGMMQRPTWKTSPEFRQELEELYALASYFR